MALELREVQVNYGKAVAVRGVSLKVEHGSAVALIGPNGAGKSTLLRCISGLIPLTKGEIRYNGIDISQLPPYERVRLGIVLVPEGRKLFPFLTVFENLVLGATVRKDRKEIKEDFERVFQLFPRLKERLKQKAGTLSGGEQQMLAIARGLMARPKLLMLDEPSLGLAPLVIKELGNVLRAINANGVSILLAEQNASLAFTTCKTCYVLRLGSIVMSGPSTEIMREDALKLAYLGG